MPHDLRRHDAGEAGAGDSSRIKATRAVVLRRIGEVMKQEGHMKTTPKCIKWHYCIPAPSDPAIVLAARMIFDERGYMVDFENGAWYNYLVLPHPNNKDTP
jgi:hypothetical protein